MGVSQRTALLLALFDKVHDAIVLYERSRK